MKLSLDKLKVSRTQSRETTAFTADLLLDGEFVGHARNDGSGGATYAYVASIHRGAVSMAIHALPPIEFPAEDGIAAFTRPATLDRIVDKLVADTDEARWLKRTCRTKTVFRLEDTPADQWLKLNHPWDEGVRGHLDKTYGDRLALVANAEPIPEPAFDLGGAP